MKISQLIERPQYVQGTFGDLDVLYYDTELRINEIVTSIEIA